MPLIKLYTWPKAFLFNLGIPLFMLMRPIYIKNILLPLVRWNQAFPLTKENLEQLAIERGVSIKLSNILINYIVNNPSFLIKNYNKWIANPVEGNWKIKKYTVRDSGNTFYLYTLIDSENKVIDFIVLDSDDARSAASFFKKSVTSKGIPVQLQSLLDSLQLFIQKKK
ncbi:DDE-type integrase/transposase/recombinase [Fluoribacter dumoffii]|uniref:DDE-type integrase/transposase/recombinase n=1 Tax=Fluoribacter dumoffii TaxID=463 RepID=UPI002244BEC2|nr:DDE-type integrase/transposase/recombinase [Fluoribacter dumoffii]MCW8418161.1 DDE-type integrase/transposase/recombinase [Fluoribacter dumoffii]MCW8453997.1 DDE-type integrase/transposase/recombinase [Fluoribacter dumoffii]MCW8461932.1 DDE-type integrase/transposase/recombinase [Fluoribacter dumoffii]MCW8482144.1 DDE-type integrase/transposase/recombinase [Fluoribacter dumoffii]